MPLAGDLIKATDVPCYSMAGGAGSISMTNASSAGAVITFPSGVFTVAPLVVAMQTSLPGSSGKLIMKCQNITASTVQIYAYTGDLTNVTVTFDFNWIAVQMTPTSATG